MKITPIGHFHFYVGDKVQIQRGPYSTPTKHIVTTRKMFKDGSIWYQLDHKTAWFPDCNGFLTADEDNTTK